MKRIDIVMTGLSAAMGLILVWITKDPLITVLLGVPVIVLVNYLVRTLMRK